MTISIYAILPDGTAIGSDENGLHYKGTPVQSDLSNAVVDTVVAADGLSYTRTTTLDGEVIGQGTGDFDGFAAAHPGVTGTALSDLWDEELAQNAHQPLAIATYTWTVI